MVDTGKVAEISGLDVGVIVAYFLIVLGVGLWSAYRSTRGTMGGFFLAGRSMHWLLVGASLFASNIGSGHFVGLAGSAAAGGIAVGGFELNAVFILMVLGWLFVPVYIASGYLQKRFGGRRIQVYLSVLTLLLYVFTKISADLFAGSIFIDKSLKISEYYAIGILLLIAMIFTVAGGLSSVIWTDAVQVVIMIIGAMILMILSFVEVGGYGAMHTKFFQATLTENATNIARYLANAGLNVSGNSSVSIDQCVAAASPPEKAFSFWLPADSGSLPWTGMTFGLTISSIWYWCSDQVIVQRALSAKNYSHAKGGCVFAAWLKFLPLFLLIFPGMIARILFSDELVCAGPKHCYEMCGQAGGCSNLAYPTLVVRLMPDGLRGLMLACMLSALMSSLTSIFNSSSTIFTIDIYPLFRKKASDTELLIAGRLFTVVLVGISVLWIPIIKTFPESELFNYIQAVTSYLAPPVCAVYVLGVFWPRCNEQGAFWGLMMGLLVGMTRFVLEIAYGAPNCLEEDWRPNVLTKVHFLHFGVLLFIISAAVIVGVSFMTAPIDKKHLHRLTFWSRHDKEHAVPILSMKDMQSTHKVYDVKGASNQTDTPAKSTNAADAPQAKQKGVARRALDFALGINQPQKGPILTDAEKQDIAEKQLSISEEPKWALFWNINAVLVMAVAIWFYAFYF